MPTNKHAIIRYRTIDRSLRNRNGQWNWESLAEVCAVEIYKATGQQVTLSERTIKGDLADMRTNDILGYYAPIEYDRKEKSYYYTDSSYAISETPINKEDKSGLQDAIRILEQFGGLSQVLGLESIITKLQHTIDYRADNSSSLIHFDHPLDSPGQEWLYVLYKYITKLKAVSIIYHPFGREKKSHIVSPYLLKEYNKRWYLIAYHHQIEGMRTYALDRIGNVVESLSSYIKLENFNGQRYFHDVVGVTIDTKEDKEIIQFEAYGVQVHYFKTRPIHQSQKVLSEDDNSALFQIELQINYELVSELLSYRSNIKVLQPYKLVEAMRREIMAMNEHYVSVDKD